MNNNGHDSGQDEQFSDDMRKSLGALLLQEESKSDIMTIIASGGEVATMLTALVYFYEHADISEESLVIVHKAVKSLIIQVEKHLGT